MLKKVAAIMGENLGIEAESITMETDLTKDLSINSIDIVNLVIDLEHEFDVEIPDRQIGKFIVVGDLVEYLNKYARRNATV